MAAAPLLLIASIGSAVFGAISSIQAGQAQAASYKSQAQASEYNATIQAQNATVARQQANAREELQRRQARQVLGAQRAAIAQSGTGLSGSNADIYGQSAANAELDAMNIRYEGELDARGLLAQSELSKYDAKVAKMNAKTAKKGGYLGAGSALLSGATNYLGRTS